MGLDCLVHGVIMNIIYCTSKFFLENDLPEAIQSNCYVLSEGQIWFDMSAWGIIGRTFSASKRHVMKEHRLKMSRNILPSSMNVVFSRKCSSSN